MTEVNPDERSVVNEVLIVGAGHAGVALAVALVKADHPGTVTLIGDEPCLPYERPPLTKRLLYGTSAVAVPLRSAEYWERSPVVLRTGERVVAVDPERRTVRTAGGSTVGYGSLVWAAGGRAAACGLPGEELHGVHTLRDHGDLTALRADLTGARRAVVIGGGYIGLEAAAALRTLGVAVTVVEVAPRLLARVTGSVVSGFFTALHRGQGVDVRSGTGVAAILGRDGRATGVRLGDDTTLPADVVIVGVGMRPTVAALVAARARGDAGGIDVDAECRTSLPGVYAIGDCARQSNPWSEHGGAMRVESVHNAGQHASAVARAIAGLPPLDPAPPRFWSTQYGRELRTVGLPAPTDEQVARGDPALGDFSVAYLRDGRLAALDAVDRPRDFARAQALVAARWCPPDPEVLASPDRDLPRLTPAAT